MGWFYNDTEITSTSTVIFDFNHTLTAKWSANTYEISFNVNGGTGTANKVSIVYDGAYPSLPTVSRTGYTFLGWYINGKKINSNDPMTTAKDHILVASWKINEYEVTFDDGSMFPHEPIYVHYGSTYGTLPDYPIKGYSFDWYCNGVKVTKDSIVNIAEDHVLYGRYTALEYYVFISENHVNVIVKNRTTGVEIKTGTLVAYGTPLSIEIVTDSGYKNGWCSVQGTKISVPNNSITMPSETLNISSGAEANSTSCLVKGTPIFLADGSTVKIENLSIGDYILTFDHTTGQYAESRVAYLFYAFTKSEIATLNFENDVAVSIVNMHGLYDATLEEYVLMSPKNVKDYVGHKFMLTVFKNGAPTVTTVELLSYNVTEKYVERYDVVTANNLNHFANGILVCSDALTGFANIFEYDNFVYNQDNVKETVEKYGLYEYQQWSDYVSYEEFVTFNCQYLKIAVEKGIMTVNDLLALADYLRASY